MAIGGWWPAPPTSRKSVTSLPGLHLSRLWGLQHLVGVMDAMLSERATAACKLSLVDNT